MLKKIQFPLSIKKSKDQILKIKIDTEHTVGYATKRIGRVETLLTFYFSAYIQRFLFSYASESEAAAQKPSCSSTKDLCKEEGTPNTPAQCPAGFRSEGDTCKFVLYQKNTLITLENVD